MNSKEPCPAQKVMSPAKWVAECQKPKGHKGKHQRWSESGTKGWVAEWDEKENK